MDINSPIEDLPSVGKARADKYRKLGISTVEDLLMHFPVRYTDYSSPVLIEEAAAGEHSVVSGVIVQKMPPARIRQGLTLYKLIAEDESGKFVITYYNVSTRYNKLEIGKEYVFEGRVNGGFGRKEMNSPNFIPRESENVLFPVYRLSEGITHDIIKNNIEYALRSCEHELADHLPDKYRFEYMLPTLSYALMNIHFPENENALMLAKKRLAFDEFLILQLGMNFLKLKSREKTGYKMENTDISRFFENLPFEMTNAQKKSVKEIISDMSKNVPMNRLLQGDVGSGKTAVAAAACFIAAENHTQAALMAPTEILAKQHFETLKKFLEPLDIKVECLTGSMSTKQKNLIRKQLKAGEIDVITGTHALISKSTEFDSLSLIITDEQHRFGVNQRKIFADKGESPHTLVMSATPIPRTLGLIIYGDLDISVLDELPKGRTPIETFAVTGKLRERALGFVKKQLLMGRQGYIVCPLVEESDVLEANAATTYREKLADGFFKGFSVGLLHGQMNADEKDEEMRKFNSGETSLLVCTTVVEVGVDVPNATVIVIENSDFFGLSQLHQLRGRVGRGKYPSSCILITDNPTDETKERLKILSGTSDGFKIAEEDLKRRGAGDFFGERQHGLPDLKIADMANDREILLGAKKASEEIIRESPDLAKFPALKAKADSMFSDKSVGN